MKLRTLAITTALAAATASIAHAAPIVFDFESLAYGTYATASQTVGGLTATLIGSSTLFDVTGAPPAAAFGSHSLLSYFDHGGSPIIANFSSAVTGVSISGTDYTPSDTDHVWLQAWSGLGGTGVLLGTITGPTCCDAFSDPPSTVFLGMSGIRSVVFWEAPGDSFQGALYLDNLTVESVSRGVPEPATWALMLAGFGLAGAALRRRAAVVA